MDKELVKERFSKAVSTYDANAQVQRHIAARLLYLMSTTVGLGQFRNVLEIGCGTGILTRMFLKDYSPKHMWLNDLCPDVETVLSDLLSPSVHFLPGDAETLLLPIPRTPSLPDATPAAGAFSLSDASPADGTPSLPDVSHAAGASSLPDVPPAAGVASIPDAPAAAGDSSRHDNLTLRYPIWRSLDLIISSSAFQWFEDLPTFFSRCAAALSPGGMMVFSTFGQENIREVTALEGSGLHYRTLEEISSMLSPHFDILTGVQEIRTMTFGSPFAVLHHLKNTGVTGVKRMHWTRGHLDSFIRRYTGLFPAEGGGVTLTYHPLYFICKKNRLI